MKPTAPIVGIDLGTTYSLVAVLSEGRPTVLPNTLGETLTPSAVSVCADGSILVGAAAKARATTHPGETFLGFKREMGTTRTFSARNKTFTPPELSALVLGALKRDAEEALGLRIEEAVITVPAYFGDLQRQATRDAGAIAGLRVERIVNEPTAAALAYGLHQRHRELKVVVLDLGGGTFDVTVLEIIEGIVEVQASAGDARLGGDDFDSALADRVGAEIRRTEGANPKMDPIGWARLIAACGNAKHRLSTATTTRIALPDLPLGPGRNRSVELEISRDEAEDAWAPLIERLRLPITRALADARVSPDEVQEILMVGGSTRMPCVARLAAQLFGRLPLQPLPPDEAVAMGAAVQAALKEQNAAVEDMVVTDVAPFTMGIATASAFGNQPVRGLFTPILERGTVIPASRVKQFSTFSDNQREIHIEVFQGERSLCKDNRHLGDLMITGLRPAPAGEGAVDVRFTYDQNGILEVEATLPDSGRKETLVLEHMPGRLTKGAIEEARKHMARLKYHPRDALPNTTALARADALYAELTGDEREHLGQTIALFRSALESQEEKVIRPLRERLIATTRELHQRR